MLGTKTLSSITREDYQFDIFELPNAEGYRYCYVWVDLATNFTVLVPARSKTAIEIKHSLERNIISIFGIPRSIYYDNERGALSGVVREVCETLGIQCSHTAPYSPQSNSNAECTVGLAKDLLRIYSKQYGKTWRQILHLVNPSINTRFLTNTMITPEKLLFGRVNQSNEIIRYNDLPEVGSDEYQRALARKLEVNNAKSSVIYLRQPNIRRVECRIFLKS